jgi:predicted RNA binding protein YcfA (HicA-like mRNA interferase family)
MKGVIMVVVKKVIKALEKDGWTLVSQKGSHIKYRKGEQTTIVPNHKGDIPKGTLSQIIKSTGIKL